MEIVYGLKVFSNIKKTPFFYSNFVTTIDGKVQVSGEKAKLYWPIGSKLDFETLLWLRAHADVLIHGKDTAVGFRTLQTLAKKEFVGKRKKLGKENDLIYTVLSNHPDEKLLTALKNPPQGVRSVLVTNRNSLHPRGEVALHPSVNVLRLGRNKVDLQKLSEYFRKNNLQKILIEGGPTLMASFLKENLIDEMFITIAPKVFGNNNDTKTMVEGYLFPPDKIPQFKLISVKNINNELYLRYQNSRI